MNKNEQALACIEETKKYASKQTELESLLPSTYFFNEPIYGLMGDFKREATGYLNKIKRIDHYLHLPQNKEIQKELINRKVYFYSSLITNYNYQKKLDSAAYYIRQVKLLEKKGFYDPYGIWYQETFYLILKGKYDDAITKIAASQDNYITGTKLDTYQSLYYLAICWNKKGDYAKSLAYCEQALANKIFIGSFLNYELELYKLAAENAGKLGDTKKTALYSTKYIAGSQKINYAAKADFIAKLYQIDIIDPLDEQLTQTKKRNQLYIIISIVLAFLTITTFGWAIIKNKRDKKKFQIVMARLEQEENRQQELPQVEEKNREETERIEELPITEIKKHTVSINDSVAEKIISQLKIFEKKQRFISPQISISTMSGDFGTNATYLSAAIKQHANTNFNNYINTLRINYIILKLKNNPEYLNYKIAYLAQESGFSSRTIFIRIFTEKTGISPSKFIAYLKEENLRGALA